MNKLNKIQCLICCLFLCLIALNASSQCRVRHVSGTETINNTEVTVTTSGLTDTTNWYCPWVVEPYLVGQAMWNWGDAETSTYEFTFYPSIDSAILNFAGVSKTFMHEEIVIIYVNGQHYPIPTVGGSTGCDTLAVLTPEGNVAACDCEKSSGWMGTVIPGPIQSLIVMDSIIKGNPGGSMFSLDICSVPVPVEGCEISIYPNPSKDYVYIECVLIEDSFEMEVFNYLGEIIDVNSELVNDYKLKLDVSHLPNAVYHVRLFENNEISNHRIIVNR